MIPRLVFAQTPHEGLVRCLKLQPQLVKAGSEPSFGFICTDAKSPPTTRGGRYVLIIHFYVESGQKMIQFNIQFKIESKIFIQ